MRLRKWLTSFALAAFAATAHAAPLETPIEHRRPADQTFLTIPEWFLVFSPEEYATSLKPATRRPSSFPFFAHIGQFWKSYHDIAGECAALPANVGYHVMITVIGISTTAEYALKGVYEGVVGHFTELVAGSADTGEDRLGAKVAQNYVDFIKVRPWYEFDFVTPLHQLWEMPATSDGSILRKWERRYMLTSEYAVKAGYAKLIEFGTRSSYAVPIEKTLTIVHPRPDQEGASLPNNTHILARDKTYILLDLPRLQAFSDAAIAVANAGFDFDEVAGNRNEILITFVGAGEPPSGGREIYRQQILTQLGKWRYAIAYKVSILGKVLRTQSGAQTRIEHIYDY